MFVTHDQEEALAVSDRIAVMRAGNIEQVGTPEELYRAPASAFTADFVGQSNRMHGDLRGGDVFVYGFTVPAIDRAAADGPVVAYVRPEDVAFASEGITGAVVSSSFLGSIRRTTVRLDDDTIVTVQHEVGDRRVAGEPVAVRLTGAPVAVEPLA